MNRRNLVKASLFLPIVALDSRYTPTVPMGGYALVSKSAAQRNQYTTIQDAINSGAAWIDVRPDVYEEVLTIGHRCTINAYGAVLSPPNDANAITIVQDGVLIEGLEVLGTHDGSANVGDFGMGVGVIMAAKYITLSRVTIRNTRSFAVLGSGTGVQGCKVQNCTILNQAADRTQIKYTNAAVLFINGAYGNDISFNHIEGWSQAVGLWYGASNNLVQSNRIQRNYGYIPVANLSRDIWANRSSAFAGTGTRSACEDYGVPNAENTGNRWLDNEIDGATSAGLELADALINTLAQGNVIRNFSAGRVEQGIIEGGGGIGVAGTALGYNVKVLDNTIYGYGDIPQNYGVGLWCGGVGTVSQGNLWVDYVNNDIGTVFIPPESVGATVDDAFVRNGMCIRVHGQRAKISGSYTDSGTTVGNYGVLYFDHSGNHTIEHPKFTNCPTRIINANQSPALMIDAPQSHNSGGIVVGQDSIIHNPNLDHMANDWTAILLNANAQVLGGVVKSDNTPIVMQGTSGAKVEGVYVTKRNGQAAPLPTGSATDTVRGNWTSGQTPP